MNFEDCKFAEHSVGHQRFLTISGILEVPSQWVRFGEPIEVLDIACLCAITDQHKEVEVRPCVKAGSFCAD